MLEVAITQLFFKHSKELLLLSNIDFKLEQGFIYTILGKNGEGKSTLLKSLTNLQDKNKIEVNGSVKFNGAELFTMPEIDLNTLRKNSIKYIFQDSLKSFDQLKKLKYYFELFSIDDEIDSTLEKFNLPRKSYLEKMHPYELSYGMSQRLAFVFALSSKPSLLLMDEPTSALDQESVEIIKYELRHFIKLNNSSVLLVTHDIDLAKDLSDFISIIENRSMTAFTDTKIFFDNWLSHN